MPEPEKEIRSERLKCPVDKTVLELIVAAPDPETATNIVLNHSKGNAENAIAIIDNLDPLTAAFTIQFLRRQSAWITCKVSAKGNITTRIVEEAEKKRVRGTLGLCSARDEVFRMITEEMGYNPFIK